ncbi:MAG: hypothetical protein JSS34_08470 [Proteobacteria bacterium]|nr:hypothetical protein [Pseudomonadota bacterium]
MFLIWGSSSMKLEQQECIEGVCSVCGHKEFIIHAFQRYGHIWWIPFFPIEKIFFLTCSQCESTVSNDSLEALVQDVNPARFKTPILSYAGFLVVACLIPLFFIPGFLKKKEKPSLETVEFPVEDVVIDYDYKNPVKRFENTLKNMKFKNSTL